ncbi:MAG: hypothetical protein V4437_00960 [Patescibacteria group bacterium]
MQESLAPEARKTLLLGGLLALTSLLLHSVPFFLFGKHPLGYDTGFYRRYVIEPLVSFPNTPVPGLGSDALLPRIVLDTLRFLHLPTDGILYGAYFVFWALVPALLFLFLKPYLQKRGAFIAGILIAFSSVAYMGYWYFLLKNALALDVLLLACIAIERRWIWLWFFIDIALVLSHKTSAIIYLLTLGILFVVSHRRRKELALHIALAGFLFTLINAPTVRELTVVLPSAVFLDWHTYFILSLPFLIAITLGVRAFWKYKIP